MLSLRLQVSLTNYPNETFLDPKNTAPLKRLLFGYLNVHYVDTVLICLFLKWNFNFVTIHQFLLPSFLFLEWRWMIQCWIKMNKQLQFLHLRQFFLCQADKVHKPTQFQIDILCTKYRQIIRAPFAFQKNIRYNEF